MTEKRPREPEPAKEPTPRAKRPYAAPAFVTTDAFERMIMACTGGPGGSSKLGQPPCDIGAANS